MGEHLSESDWEQIRKFAETPAYERSPEILSEAADRDDRAEDATGSEQDE